MLGQLNLCIKNVQKVDEHFVTWILIGQLALETINSRVFINPGPSISEAGQ